MHSAGADAEQRDRQADAQQLIREAELGQVIEEAAVVVQLDREVADDDKQRADGGEGEERRDLAFGLLGRLLVHVRHTVHVIGKAGVAEPLGKGLGALCGDLSRTVMARFVVGDHRSTRLVAHEDFDPSQAAKPIRTVSPITQATKPSLTGPIRPSERPPGFGVSFTVVR